MAFKLPNTQLSVDEWNSKVVTLGLGDSSAGELGEYRSFVVNTTYGLQVFNGGWEYPYPGPIPRECLSELIVDGSGPVAKPCLQCGSALLSASLVTISLPHIMTKINCVFVQYYLANVSYVRFATPRNIALDKFRVWISDLSGVTKDGTIYWWVSGEY